MRVDERKESPKTVFFILALLLCISLPLVAPVKAAQASADADQLRRQRAITLFNEGKRLEALPLLEDLAQKDPQDSEVLVALAACLIRHAATLTDADRAAKERFRARDLLQKAWALGDASPVAENLRQLLGELPANGAIKFSDHPAVEQAMNGGEAAFARRDFDEALKDYGKALELEPTNYSAVLFTANTYDRRNDLAKAGEWYERAMRLDPNIETAYRYYADMLAKEGDMAKARTMLIHAAVAEPYNKIVWREIRAWALINKTAFNLVYVGIPLSSKADAISGPSPEVVAAWRAYYSVKDGWKKGGKFEKQFPQQPTYRHTLAEEDDALTTSAQMLEKLRQDKNIEPPVASDPNAMLLLRLYDAQLIAPYVLFSLGDDDIAKDYAAYRAKNRDKLETYMDQFVMPPAHANRSSN